VVLVGLRLLLQDWCQSCVLGVAQHKLKSPIMPSYLSRFGCGSSLYCIDLPLVCTVACHVRRESGLASQGLAALLCGIEH
jgi:hypothetical protein